MSIQDSMKKPSIILIAIVLITALSFLIWYLGGPLVTDTIVDEELPLDLQSMIDEPDVVMDEEMPHMADAVDEIEVPTEPVEPQVTDSVLFTGMFRDADNFHKGSGQVIVHEFSSGERFLRFEDFSVTNGPDLRVLLSANSNVNDSGDLGEYIELDRLKGNKGNQNYEIPTDLDISMYGSVVIYCKPFHVVFSTAELN